MVTPHTFSLLSFVTHNSILQVARTSTRVMASSVSAFKGAAVSVQGKRVARIGRPAMSRRTAVNTQAKVHPGHCLPQWNG